jgi:hypothetical protein
LSADLPQIRQLPFLAPFVQPLQALVDAGFIAYQ